VKGATTTSVLAARRSPARVTRRGRVPAAPIPRRQTKAARSRLTASLLLPTPPTENPLRKPSFADKPSFGGKPTLAPGQGQDVAAGRRFADRSGIAELLP